MRGEHRKRRGWTTGSAANARVTVATSTVLFRTVTGIRELSDGRVLVNDGSGRTVLILDQMIQHARLVLDSAAGLPNSYGTGSGQLLPWRGDSSLFYHGSAHTFVRVRRRRQQSLGQNAAAQVSTRRRRL
jgi:hypothetical protein